MWTDEIHFALPKKLDNDGTYTTGVWLHSCGIISWRELELATIHSTVPYATVGIE